MALDHGGEASGPIAVHEVKILEGAAEGGGGAAGPETRPGRIH